MDALVIFAKAPNAGEVKTRLQPMISKEAAARLSAALVEDIVEMTGFLPVTRVLACSPSSDHPFFTELSRREKIKTIAQRGEDLGERLASAFDDLFAWGFENVVIVGSDSPTLPPEYLEEAFDRLESAPVVLGPAVDGGYYLVGAKQRTPEIFRDIVWGSEQVLAMTLARIREKGIRAHLLPFWYDVDQTEDLAFLREHLLFLRGEKRNIAPRTSALLEEFAAANWIVK